MNSLRYLVRGIRCVNGYILLAHHRGADNRFLPGGHVDPGEKAHDCLCRELKQELALQNVHVGRFLGAVEHKWEVSGLEQFEINLVFELRLAGIAPPTPPESLEEHLEFLWAKPDELAGHNLQPSPPVDYIGKHMNDREAFWGSTL